MGSGAGMAEGGYTTPPRAGGIRARGLERGPRRRRGGRGSLRARRPGGAASGGRRRVAPWVRSRHQIRAAASSRAADGPQRMDGEDAQGAGAQLLGGLDLEGMGAQVIDHRPGPSGGRRGGDPLPPPGGEPGPRRTPGGAPHQKATSGSRLQERLDLPGSRAPAPPGRGGPSCPRTSDRLPQLPRIVG